MKNQTQQNQMSSSVASSPMSETSAQEKKKRGFAAMDRNQVQEVARKGGMAAHRAGKAHEFNSEEARAAGRKGGLAWHPGRPVQEQAPAPVSAEIDQDRA
jgi:general stress protein YciG